ncbi:MAG: MBOAT family O-acyltransferase [Myxococcota bacterium]|nr:MBOAT family O-acyltransferase [Myxococcota bacterium]
MLFNSTLFLFAFLPIVLGGFLALQRWDRARFGVAWLVASSLVFYAWAQPSFLLLLLASILGNFSIGLWIQGAGSERGRRAWCVLGVVLNVALLAVFKYAGFAVEIVQGLGAQDFRVDAIALPLAISFFTFQQISYLSDTAQGRVSERSLLHYTLFIAFFPKLVAGPIVHHDEMLDQVHALPERRVVSRDVAVGLTLFSMGLFKKVILADALAARTGAFFDLAAAGVSLNFFEAWTAALGFSFQVYFDFSGYTDMALGLARCFGIVLPLNFHAPYKATNISQFWRRWHITLTRWLRLYIFIPVSRGIMRRGGGRWDTSAIVVGQMLTMGLCGLWHGAGWNFVVWGLLHGVLLVGYDGWTVAKRRLGLAGSLPAPVGLLLGRATLFACLAATFVVFRAADLAVAGEMLRTMSGADGVWTVDTASRLAVTIGFEGGLLLVGLLAIVWYAPSSHEILGDDEPALDVARWVREPLDLRWRWRPTPGWALAGLAALLPGVYWILIEGHEEFIYRFF